MVRESPVAPYPLPNEGEGAPNRQAKSGVQHIVNLDLGG